MPRFTEEFFTRHVPHWEALFFGEFAWDPETRRHVVEIGCFEGRSTLWFLEHLLRHPDSRTTCVDTFAGGAEHTASQSQGLHERFLANLGESGQAHRPRCSGRTPSPA